jgi:phosphate starvation-inducible protein PhoH and related proteins
MARAKRPKRLGGSGTPGFEISIKPRNKYQEKALTAIRQNDITFLVGPAGSGKTRLAVVSALQETFSKKQFSRIIFTRPCVEAHGESLGWLPGDFNEKISPYMFPIMDMLLDFFTEDLIEKYNREGTFCTLPLAYQRGMSFNRSFVILDEAQNTVPEQVLMFLTRLGEDAKMVITGDPGQSDLSRGNGLVDAVTRLKGVDGIEFVDMPKSSIVRNPLVSKILDRYA